MGGEQSLDQRQEMQPEVRVFCSDGCMRQQVLYCRDPAACSNKSSHLCSNAALGLAMGGESIQVVCCPSQALCVSSMCIRDLEQRQTAGL